MSIISSIFVSISLLMPVFIGIEGYTLPSGFILKELCIIYPNDDWEQYLFQSPIVDLTEADERTIRYASKNLNGLGYSDGYIAYSQIGNTLDPVKDDTIYTYSDIAVCTLQKYLPTTVIINIQDKGFLMPKKLPDSGCFRKHCQRYCAKAKAIEVKKFMGY